MIKSKYISIIFIVIFSILFTLSYLSLESGIYWADMSGYWSVWKYFSNILYNDPLKALSDLFLSIKNDDYNQSPIILNSIFYFLPINDRFSYILSNVLLYLIPLVLIISKIAKYFFEDKRFQAELILLAITYPAFWTPILRGYPDIIGVTLISFIIVFVYKNDYTKKVNIKKAFMLGILLWLPFLFRRWYLYTIISLYLSLPVFNYFIFNAKISKKELKFVLLNFFISGSVTIFFTLLLQLNMIKRVLLTSYAEIYSAYQSDLSSSFYSVLGYSGNYFLFFALIGIISSFIAKKKIVKLFVIFCLFNLFVSFLFFTRTQAPGMQHNLPFSFWIFCLVIVGFIFLLKILGFFSKYMAIMIVLGGLLSQLYVFFNLNIVSKISENSPVQILPVKFNNANNYFSLSKVLENKLKDKDKVTVFSSSDILNEGILVGVNDSLRNFISPMSHVDLRDHFNMQSIMSKYIVITVPIQLHLPRGQNVISIPVNSILSKSNIGKAYERLNYEFILDGGVKAYIYEKKRNYTVDEINEFLEHFYEIYPNWRKIYNDKTLISYLIGDVSLGDIWGDYSFYQDKIVLHPGDNISTKVIFSGVEINELEFFAFNSQCNIDDPIKITIGDSITNLIDSFLLKKGEKKNITYEKKFLYIEISKVDSSGCDGVSLKIK